MAPLKPAVEKELPPGRGFVAPLKDLPHLNGGKMPSALSTLAPPESFDWRDSSKVTSVKNQGVCGSCYAFSSIASFESKVLMDADISYDFSENNAKECNYLGTSCSGGNFYDLASLFSQQGVVLESCDSYVAANVSCNTACPHIKTLLGWNIICTDATPNTAVLQNYILTYGPVYTTVYAGDGDAWDTEFNNYDGSYTMYYSGTEPTNHAVLIVGWDNSLVHAGGTGGWIVKNTWGSSWGDNGYFTIAYGSANIGQWSSFVSDWQDYNVNEDIMYYDEAGWTSEFGIGSTTSWGLAALTPVDDVYLNRVEFWTTDITTDVDIYIYDSFNGSSLSGLLASQLNQSYSEAGYHSVLLDSPPEITAGNEIFVAVKITNSTYGFPVAVDYVGPEVPGKTYMSANASTWYDMGTNYNVDVAMRIRTIPTFAVSVDENEDLKPYTYSLSCNYPNPFNPMTTINYSLEKRTRVDISIYNVLGQKVSTVVNEVKPAGEYSATWNGTDDCGHGVASGIYLYKLETDEYVETRKMVLLK
ncbi:MAG: C1 family peptidase [Candidatus Zixiibacteriota bacterium]